MRKIRLLMILSSLPAVAGICAAQQQAVRAGEAMPEVACTERITEEQLVRLRQTSKPFASNPSSQPVTVSANKSFAESSEFIAFNGLCTFVPKGAVLHVPERMRQYIVPGLAGEVVFWGDFLRRFPAVVERFEITIQEASGEKPIEPTRLASAMRSERIIVTVIQGNPTSLCKIDPKNAKQSP